ncbi:MAG: ShlB/FhaC/HecB family hemolysin secretion/activation protein [Erythrobacter sp.]|nr:ShlB/FhaC/HecB family hemolysin secretion/activation protein [Erythrobacter sp.]
MLLRILVLLISLGGLTTSLAAQTALDRTEPTQGADDDRRERDIDDAPPAVPLETAEPAAAEPSSGNYLVSSILIEGNEALPDAIFVDVMEAFTATALTSQDLAVLADAVARRARDRGYIFATAAIPRQNLELGILRVVLDEGRVDRLRIDGAQDAAIRRQLEPLLSGTPITRDELERRLLLADDISGVRVLDAQYEKDGDAGVLVLRTRRDRVRAELELRNNGSAPVGPERARFELDLNGVISSADELDLAVGVTPFEPGELQSLQASYRNVVSSSGLELGLFASYSATEPGAFLETREIEGRFWRAGLDLSYPVLRRRDASAWLVSQIDVSDLRQKRSGEVARHDRVPAIRAGIYSRGTLAGGDYRGRVLVSHGLGILDATQRGDPLASRDDASAQFTSLYAWGIWDRPIGYRWSIAFAGRGQLASDPVLATEDLGLGGTSFLRAYNFNERSGDQGIMGYGELRYDLQGEGDWFRRSQMYVFFDGGVVSNLEEGRGGGSLASAGGGLRFALTRDLDMDLELAFPLTGERFDTESSAPLMNVRIEQVF